MWLSIRISCLSFQGPSNDTELFWPGFADLAGTINHAQRARLMSHHRTTTPPRRRIGDLGDRVLVRR
jgi:hypothetical protein